MFSIHVIVHRNELAMQLNNLNNLGNMRSLTNQGIPNPTKSTFLHFS